MFKKILFSLLIFLFLTSTANAAGPQWGNDYWKAMEKAKVEKKYVFLYFTRDNCSWCDKFEKETFSHPYLKAYLEKYFVLCQVNATRQPTIAEPFRPFLKGYPAYFVLNSQQKVRANSQGYRTPIEFARWSDSIWRKQ